MQRDEYGGIHFQRGFTLVEVLVAILVLLVGVVVVLRIFPRGFDILTRTQLAASATQQANLMLQELVDHPENMPDSIEPVVNAPLTAWDNTTLTPTFLNTGIPFFTWDNLYTFNVNGFSYNNNFTYKSYGLGGDGPWLLGEPLSLRVLRRVVGEHCVIPSAVSTGTGWFAPNYCVRYGPIERASSLMIYDLRYRRLNQNKFSNIVNAPDNLYYDIDYDKGMLFFPSSTSGQSVRVTYTVQGASAVTNVFTIAAGTPPMVTLPAKVMPGSEQIYRAYTAQPTPTGLISGQYSLQYRTPANPSDPIGLIFFAQADAGHTVKIDYTVLDWNILHDDVTVDQAGALELGLLPKLYDVPNPPRETKSWALYEPISNDSIVMELVNLQTGADSPVTVNNPALASVATVANGQGRNYICQMQNGPLVVTYYLVQDPHNSRRFFLTQVGDGPFLGNSGQALAGQTFRVYYRAVHDWSRQIFRAPANMQSLNSPLANLATLQTQTLQWGQFAWAPDAAFNPPGITATGTPTTIAANVLTFTAVPPGVQSGMQCTVAGDSSSYSVTAVTATTVTLSTNPSSATPAVWTFYSMRAWLAVQGFFAGQTVAVDYSYGIAAPFTHVSGEAHSVPIAASGQTLSFVLLTHCPASGTTVSVRGISVTARALWTQARSGPAIRVQDATASVTTVPDSWLSRQETTILPANVE